MCNPLFIYKYLYIYTMEFKTIEEVIDLIKKSEPVKKWVSDARAMTKTLKALVYGDNFLEELIEKIEKIESSDRATARKKYAKDIRDMFNRVNEPRDNVFSASGGSTDVTIASEQVQEKFFKTLNNFKGNKSLSRFLSEYFFELLDVDPNGVLFMEYIKDEKIYPTYKSINDIRHYETDGQNVNLIIFEPVKINTGGGKYVTKWRIVDNVTDWTVIQQGETFTVSEELTFKHVFDRCPAIVLSDVQKLGTEERLSYLFPIVELAKDYARDKSILTIYKFLNGQPIHWRYTNTCRACKGTGKTGEKACTTCNGKGVLGKNDVTDVLELSYPREGDPIVAPDLAGFVSPDLKTWEQYRKDQREDEIKIEDTLWGTHRTREQGNETATGRFIDVQPVMNKLNVYAMNVEWVHNQLAKWTLQWVNNNKATKDKYFHTYGRGFIIESPDALLARYETARINGSSWTILDKLLSEYMMSKYQNNPVQLNEMVKKSQVEPFVHMSVLSVNEVFGPEQAGEKELFGDFWEQADTTKDVAMLKAEFKTYVQINKIVIPNTKINEQE